jgi:hypothetical protein
MLKHAYQIFSLVVLAVGPMVTVLTVALSLIGFRSARSQVRELGEIRQSLSTRYIGQFPDYIPEVVDLIKTANKEILIAYGQVTFGLFSWREQWLEYRTALEQKLQEGITVDLLCLDDTQRKTHQMEQFSLDKMPWDQKINDAQFKERLQILEKHYSTKNVAHLDRDAFLAVLEDEQKRVLNNEFRTAIITEIDVPFAMHAWVVDSRRAIFTVPNFAEGPSELGFSTSDVGLIKAIESIHLRYKNRRVVPRPNEPRSRS